MIDLKYMTILCTVPHIGQLFYIWYNIQYFVSLRCIWFGDACVASHLYCYSHSSPRWWFSMSSSESVGNINIHGDLLGFCSDFFTCWFKRCSVFPPIVSEKVYYISCSCISPWVIILYTDILSSFRLSVSPSQLNEQDLCMKTALVPLKETSPLIFILPLVMGSSAETWCTVCSASVLDLFFGCYLHGEIYVEM